MISQLKTQLYQILKEDLDYNVTDNPYGEETKSFPYVLVTLSNAHRDKRKNTYLFSVTLKIDIFSDYNGEKEILEMEEEIFDNIEKLYDIELVTYLRESGFRIIDDKSTGVLRKHGIINYTIYSTGGIADNG